MPGQLSHELDRLCVSGNRIIRSATGEPVELRGIVRSGLEYSPPDASGSLSNAGITAREIQEIVSWGANIVRLPFNQDWALRRPGYDPSAYLNALDFVIEAAASRGAYTLLDLQWLDATTPRGRNQDGTLNFVAPLPNLLTIDLWRQISLRYAGESAVLYDIFNEPHDSFPDDRVQLLGIKEDGTTFPLPSRCVTMAEWQPWATHLVNAVRSNNPGALIFVSGVDWAYDLRGFPVAGLPDIVYSTHVYRNKGNNWDEAFGKLSSNYPVFAAEWGCRANDIEWGRRLVQYMGDRGIGWTAWSWSDSPRLVEIPLAPDYRPTAFGQLVRDSLWHIQVVD